MIVFRHALEQSLAVYLALRKQAGVLVELVGATDVGLVVSVCAFLGEGLLPLNRSL